ncbi:Uncharacterised protein [Streptococcus pneumoniae]|nr:Uncharacterised protein [Streptococcus pneumoniae]
MPLRRWRVSIVTPVRWAMIHQPSPSRTVYVPGAGAGAGVGAGAVAAVMSTMPGCRTVDAVMPLSRWSSAALTPVRRAMTHQPSFGCTV